MSDKLRGSKRDALIAAGKAGHRVLVFGQQVFGPLTEGDVTHENASIRLAKFPEEFASLPRLLNFSLVILDYQAFKSGSADPHLQDIFEKQMFEALDAGVTFCFVHYDEPVPTYDPYGFSTGHMEQGSIDKCRATQIGFRWLVPFSIRPARHDNPIVWGDIKRNVFKSFLDRWGASRNFFSAYNEGEFADTIVDAGEGVALGFALNSRKGRLIFLPFQRNFTSREEITNALHSLIDCLLTYLTKSLVEVPEWAAAPFFKEEITIKETCDELEQRLEATRALLQPFEEAKAILFQQEYTLERTVPAFIQTHLGIKTLRDETHKEDFWILNERDEKTAIAEVKSVVKGFKKKMIYDLYTHRDENKLDESFPALLVANCNLQAGSWKDKDRVIDKQDYQVAAQNNVLILRVEDLVRLWESTREGIHTSEEIYNLLMSNRGWLEVSPSFELRIRS